MVRANDPYWADLQYRPSRDRSNDRLVAFNVDYLYVPLPAHPDRLGPRVEVRIQRGGNEDIIWPNPDISKTLRRHNTNPEVVWMMALARSGRRI